MTAPKSNLLISVTDSAATIKVLGRANFNVSAQFKQVVNELHKRGTRIFNLLLDECLMMDSTFLGMLAAFGLDKANATDPATVPDIQLVNPNERILDSLENLEVAQLFTVTVNQVKPPPQTKFEDAGKVCLQPSRKEVTRHSLESHKTLMDIEPSNVPRFKDVVRFLEEDLKRQENSES